MALIKKHAYETPILKQAYQAYCSQSFRYALELCEQSLMHEGEHYDSLFLQAQIFAELQQRQEAKSLFEALNTSYPKDIDILFMLAVLEEKTRNFLKSTQYYKEILEIEPNHHYAQYLYALSLEGLNELGAAKEFIFSLCDSKKEKQQNLSELPQALIYVLAKIYRREKKHTKAIDLLSQISVSEDIALEIRKQFELGLCLEKQEEYIKAYSAIEHAHTLIKQAQAKAGNAPSKEKFLKTIEEQRTIFASPLEPSSIATTDHSKLCFMIGFPRSGTTLLEQMLSSHSDIEILSEIPLVQNLYQNALSDFFAEKKINASIDNDEINTSAFSDEYKQYLQKHSSYYQNLYWDLVKRSHHKEEQDNKTHKIFIDKMPTNIIYLGFLHIIFPSAQFILSLRHPASCMISNFFQHYDTNPAMENMRSLEDIANLYTQCFALFLSLEKNPTIQSQIARSKYEDLILNNEQELQKLCDFLHIDFQEDMIDNRIKQGRQKGVKAVNTPSYQQISEPLYKTSLYRWKNYKQYIEPFMDKLSPFLQEFGYSKSSITKEDVS